MADDPPLQSTVFVALGGALGTLLRHLLNVVAFVPAVPIATAIENITGAFALGITAGLLATARSAPDWVRTGVGVGFCGGYTTMSTFAADSFVVYLHQSPGWAAVYAGCSVLFGVISAGFGLRLGRSLGESVGGKT